MITMTPLGRLGQPAEVAAGVAYLASDDASFVTGLELYIDGGYMPADPACENWHARAPYWASCLRRPAEGPGSRDASETGNCRRAGQEFKSGYDSIDMVKTAAGKWGVGEPAACR